VYRRPLPALVSLGCYTGTNKKNTKKNLNYDINLKKNGDGENIIKSCSIDDHFLTTMVDLNHVPSN